MSTGSWQEWPHVGSTPELKALIEAAIDAGSLLNQAFYVGMNSRLNDDSSDWTPYDEQAEQRAIGIIREYFPQIAVVSEEIHPEAFSNELARKDFVVIDGVDGTTNFSRGIPIANFTCAYVRPQQNDTTAVYAGVVFDFIHDELFYALSGHGAYKNGKQINVNDQRRFEECLLSFAPLIYVRSKRPTEKEAVDRVWQAMRRLAESSHRFQREFQSGALELAWVAEGRLDGYASSWTSPWDLSAGTLLVSEAGGVVTDIDGNLWEPSYKGVVAGSAKIQARMIDALR